MWFWPSLSRSNSGWMVAMYKWFDLSCFLFPVSFSPDSVWADAKGVSREHVLFVNNWMLLLPLLLCLHLLVPVSLSLSRRLCLFSLLLRHPEPTQPSPDFKRDSRCSLGFLFFFPLLSPVADSHVNVWRPCARAVASKTRQNPKRSNDLRPSVITGDWKWRGVGVGRAARITSHMCMNKWCLPF